MKKILITGTFDLLHKGHDFFLRESKKHGDYLVVVIASDKTLTDLGKKHKNPEQVRLEQIREHPAVDEAVLGSAGKDKLRIVLEKKPDIICLGYDQTFFTENLKEKLAQRGLHAEIVRIRAFKPEIFKSSKLRK